VAGVEPRYVCSLLTLMQRCAAACVPLTAALVGWFLSPQSSPHEFEQPPRVTNATLKDWSGVPWPPAVTFGPGERKQFEAKGFAVLRSFLSPAIVRELLAAHAAWCPRGVFSPHWHCKNEDVWARTDIYRDFLYWSPLGKTVRSLLGVTGLRIYGDHVTEMRSNHPGIFYHFDNIYYGGVLGEFHAASRGAIVFLFLTGVDHATTGGSVLLQPGGHRDSCVMAGVEPALQAPCRELFYKQAIALSFKPGDALIIHPLMPHASQGPLPTAPAGFRRITYLARLVEGDATFCTTDTQVRETGKVDCRHSLRPGQKAHHVCYQQIDPLLAPEISERMSPAWYTSTCNVCRGWRYTTLARLRLGVRTLLSRLRIRLHGGKPIGLEKAECIYPP